MWRLNGLLAVVVCGACVSEVEPGWTTSVEVGGCSEMIDAPGGSSCELVGGDPRQISVWVSGGLPSIQIDDVRQAASSRTEIDGGYRVEIEIPDGARALTLSRDEPAAERWRLPFVWTDPHSSTALTRATTEMQTAYIQSNLTECQSAAKVVYRLAHQQRRNSNAMLAARTGAHCTEVGAWREWAFNTAQIPPGIDEREADRAATEAEFFLRQGALSQALSAADRGQRRALHLGMSTTYVELGLMKANLLIEIGDFALALTTMNEALKWDSHPCTRASIHLNLAWAHLQWAERAATTNVEEVHRELRRGLALGTKHACRREDMIPFGFNTARALQIERKWGEANAELKALAQPLATLDAPPLHAEFRLLKARAALALGQPLAARDSLGAAELPEDLPLDLELDLMMVRGEVEAALGSDHRSLTVYLDAHRRTLDRLRGVPWDGGRQRFVFDRLRGVQRLVEIYRGPFADDAAAFRVAREAAGAEARWLARREGSVRRRQDYLAWRAEREGELVDAWDLSPSERHQRLASAQREGELREAALFAPDHSFNLAGLELQAPQPGELVLFYFPTGAHRFLVFGATRAGIRVMPIELTPSELMLEGDAWTDEALQAWSERLLVPLAAEVDGAQRIRILPSFGVQALPFHALPWRGRPLLSHAQVVYSMDLPVRGGSDLAKGALIVGDPLGDLAGARQEAEAVRAAHAGSGVEFVSLVGHHEATGPEVRRLLPHVRHLYYAGHGTTAGAFGWDSTLRLAQDTSLTVADVVALERVPQTVVLLSCHGGHVSRDPRSQGVSLAAAFLFAGSEAVIAMATSVDEAEAPLLSSSFHAPPTDAADLSVIYRTGMQSLMGTASDAAWQGLRLWVP